MATTNSKQKNQQFVRSGESDSQRYSILEYPVQKKKKIMKHKEKQESIACKKVKKGVTETVPEKAQTFKVLVKNIKSMVLNMLNELKETVDKRKLWTKVKETRKMM